MAAAMLKGAIIGGAIGAGVSAIMGGDPLKGFIAGAIGGAFGGMGILAGWGPVGVGLMGAAGGAVGAVATGGDPVLGAITGGISAGVMAALQFAPIQSFADLFTKEALKQLTISTSVGAMVGGATAEMFGGEFEDGAIHGAASSAAGFVMCAGLVEFIEPVADRAVNEMLFAIDIALDVTLKIWNSPNTAIGLAYGFAGVLFGGDWPVWWKNGLHFRNSPLQPIETAVTLGNAMTYGEGSINPITGTKSDPYMVYRDHEIAHTYQGELLGPLYLPLHMLDKLKNGLGPEGWLERGPYSNPPRPWP